MTEAELRSLLRRLDLQPSRKLGQNFLVDENISRWIARQLEAGPADPVIEIGPGCGALTAHLAGAVGRLTLVEKDGRLAGYLGETYGSEVEVIHGDATRFDIGPRFRDGEVRLIGNLPYSAGTEILRNLLEPPTPVVRAIIMLQREVAERLCAAPGSRSYGALSLLMQSRWHITQIKTVGPQSFHPRPEVDSTVICLEPRGEDELPPYCPEVFTVLVKQGFSRRRKQLHNNLAADGEVWDSVSRDLGLERGVRAEALDLETWVRLSNALQPHPCAALPPVAEEWLEVVDENDEVCGRMPRAEIHATGARHRAVHVFLLNRKGDLYLQKRSRFKDSHPGKWDSSASGHLDPGESYLDSAIRELGEELWLEAPGGLRRVARLGASEETDQEFIEVFEARGAGRPRVHTSEIHSGRFFGPTQVAEWVAERPEDFATGFRACFAAWRRERIE